MMESGPYELAGMFLEQFFDPNEIPQNFQEALANLLATVVAETVSNLKYDESRVYH